MKKVLSLIFIMLMMSAVASAEVSAPPSDGLKLWIEASEEQLTIDSNNKVDAWTDKSGNSNELVQTEATSRRPLYLENATGLKSGGAVKFVSNQYMIKEDVNYSGNASFVVYFKLNNCIDGHTVFSSHAYEGEPITTANKIPFSIMLSEGNLVFKTTNPSEEEIVHDMNVSVYKEDGSLKDYMMLFVTITGKTVNVYLSEHITQQDLTEPVASFNLESVPYWQSYAYNLAYDTTSRVKGMQGEIAESMIYHKALSIEEINNIHKYIKIKYEKPVLTRMYLKSHVTELPKGRLAETEVVGVGSLMGMENEIPLDGFTIASSNEESIIVLNGKIKAIGFGSSVITVSYPGIESVSYVVSVPQLTINDVSVEENTDTVTISQVIENIAEQRPISLMMAAAVYKGNMLVDVKTEKAVEFVGEHSFSATFELPDEGDSVHMSIIYADTLAPVCDFTKEY